VPGKRDAVLFLKSKRCGKQLLLTDKHVLWEKKRHWRLVNTYEKYVPTALAGLLMRISFSWFHF
jgi:hypothetical protein